MSGVVDNPFLWTENFDLSPSMARVPVQVIILSELVRQLTEVI